jgi:hypothetical protein
MRSLHVSPDLLLGTMRRFRFRIAVVIWIVLIWIVFSLSGIRVYAQTRTQYDVFLDPDTQELLFMDVRSGLSTVVLARGTQHALLPDGVLFQAAESGQAQLARPDGTVTAVAWIQPSIPSVTVRWQISANRERIAWSAIQADGANVISLLFAAKTDGTASKLVLRASSTKGLATLPISINNGGTSVYYTRQPLPNPQAYRLFEYAADLYLAEVETGDSRHLPNEPQCDCGVAVTSDGRQYARLITPPSGGGFGLTLRDITSAKQVVTLPPIENFTHTLAGDAIMSDDGNVIVYASARGTGRLRSERWTLTVASRVANGQSLLLDAPLVDGLRPIAFSADRSSVILVGITKPGTWKLALAERTLVQTATATFLGSLEVP